jgi:starch synthase
MKVLFVASEVAPLAKVGGLADVAGSLPKALYELGYDVRIIMPKYGSIKPTKSLITTEKYNVKFSRLGEPQYIDLKTTTLENKVPVYMVENQRYFGSNEVYSKNDLARFLFFCRAVSQLLPQLDWQPEIVHCHDWHTSLIVIWLKKARYPCRSIFTIHNLAYQGAFDNAFLVANELEKYWSDYPAGAPKLPLNFMSQGILWADLVTTVSETYAKEILTPECGEGLDTLLNYRKESLLGIVNGIDYKEYNPNTDPYIPANYDSLSLENRVNNKLALQKKAGLPEATTTPVIGMVQRLDEQKGFDIIEKAINPLMNETNVQMVILGRGRRQYENMVRKIASKYPQRISALTAFDNPLAHLIYSGCDMFLMPSRFEPCGLGQLIAMRYGALPIVRHTGGLVDTVTQLNPDLSKGNGFIFRDYNSEALVAAINEALDAYRNRKAWQQVMQRVMGLDFSWQASALKYDAAYKKVLEATRPT